MTDILKAEEAAGIGISHHRPAAPPSPRAWCQKMADITQKPIQ